MSGAQREAPTDRSSERWSPGRRAKAVWHRLSVATMLAGGLLWVGSVLSEVADGELPGAPALAGLILVGGSLPGVLLRHGAIISSPRQRWAVADVWALTGLLTGLVLVLLVHFQLVLIPAAWLAVGVSDGALQTGRRVALAFLGTGLLALATAPGRLHQTGVTRVLCGAAGVWGLMLAAVPPYPLLLTWLLGIGALWLWLALESWAPRGAGRRRAQE